MILRELWRKRRWTAAIVLLSALIAFVAVEQSPNVQFASANTEILFNSQDSALIDSGQIFTPLALTAQVYSSLMTSPRVTAAIARAAQLPPGSVVTDAPVVDSNLPRSLSEPDGNEVSTELLTEGGKNRVSFKATPDLPIIDVFVQAPNPKNAIALANASVAGVRSYLSTIEDDGIVPHGQRIQVSQLGGASGGWVNRGASYELGAIVFVLASVVGCVLVIVFGRVIRDLRSRLHGGGEGMLAAGNAAQAAPPVGPAPTSHRRPAPVEAWGVSSAHAMEAQATAAPPNHAQAAARPTPVAAQRPPVGVPRPAGPAVRRAAAPKDEPATEGGADQADRTQREDELVASLLRSASVRRANYRDAGRRRTARTRPDGPERPNHLHA